MTQNLEDQSNMIMIYKKEVY